MAAGLMRSGGACRAKTHDIRKRPARTIPPSANAHAARTRPEAKPRNKRYFQPFDLPACSSVPGIGIMICTLFVAFRRHS